MKADSFSTIARLDCPLCGSTGRLFYEGLRDRYFDAPGDWSLRQCPKNECGLVWIDPVIHPSDVGLLYSRYYTHDELDVSSDWSRRIHHLLVSIYIRRLRTGSSK